MCILFWPAKLISKKNTYIVEFINLKGCGSEGSTKFEALENAQDALTLYLETIYGKNYFIPKQKKISGKNIYYIVPSLHILFAYKLKDNRLKQNKTQKEFSKKLNMKYQTYQKFENFKQTNPSLKTIEKIIRVLGNDILLDIFEELFQSLKNPQLKNKIFF